MNRVIALRLEAFQSRFGLRIPILQAPMAAACPPALAVAVANAGGMGGCGALQMGPDAIAAWSRQVRAGSNGAFQINLWIPDPPPLRDAAHEARVASFIGEWGPPVPDDAGDAALPDFAAQCEALLAARPAVISSIMGLFDTDFAARMRAASIAWFATVTSVAEARAAAAAGADALIVQGMEAGGHRGRFDNANAEAGMVGGLALIPAVADAVALPLVATGGIADGRGVAAALLLGASAVQIGTAFLRCPETGLAPAWAEALGRTAPEDTMVTRAFSGRAGRSLATDYARAAAGGPVAPYPVQRGLTAAMREDALRMGDVQRMQAWAGQAAALARAEPAGEVVERIWRETLALLA
ncbi:MAG: nitronate monooxygenase [Rubritepida sp.]|nr:nitronate monooxygenase [Rubritepida sp.]